MPLIPDDKIAEIRERIDIVQLLGEHVQLKRAGVNWKGLCPFHAERTPSFNVNPARQLFVCFGCGEKGDVFSFFMKLESKGFMEVARELAKRASIDLPERERSPEELRAEGERERHVKVNELASQFYRECLLGEAGVAARAYLEQRGIDDATSELFRLGYAPDGWDALAKHLDAKKVPPQYGLATGLIGVRERSSGHYDKFRGRLMCPVFNLHGEVVAFSGRLLDPEAKEAKYINSPESPVYTKGRLLFGAFQARDSFAKKRRAILVEGNFDVVSLHRHGLGETVCPLGTALTSEQVDILKKRVERVVVMLDADGAGRKATLRSTEMLIRAGVPTYVATLDTGDDPDSYARRVGGEMVLKRIDAAVRAIKHFIDNLPRLVDLDPIEAVEHAKIVVPLIQAIPDEAARHMAAAQVEAATGVRYEQTEKWVADAQRAAEKAAAAAAAASVAKVHPNAPPQRFSAEEQLIGLVADHPALRNRIKDMGLAAMVRNPAARAALEAAQNSADDKSAPRDMLDAAPAFAHLIMDGHFAKTEAPEEALAEAARTLRQRPLLAELDALNHRVKVAQRTGDPSAAGLAQQVLELKRKLNNLLADSPPVGQAD